MPFRLLIALTLVLAGGPVVAVAQDAADAGLTAEQADARDRALVAAFVEARQSSYAGRYPEAVDQFRAVTDQASALLGPAHEQTLIAHSWLALSLAQAGRRDEAYVEANAVMDAGAARFGMTNESVDRVQPVLALEAMQKGDLAAAISILQASFEVERTAGWQEQATNSAAMLAMAYRLNGQSEAADAALARVERSDDELGDISDLQTADGRGDADATLAAADRVLAHDTLAPSVRAIAVIARTKVLGQRGDAGDAEAGRMAQSELRAFLSQPLEPLTQLLLQDALAQRLADGTAPQKAEALTLWRDGMVETGRILGEDHPSTVSRAITYGVRLGDFGRRRDGLAVLDKLLARNGRSPGLLSPLQATNIHAARGNDLFALGRWSEGYASLRAAGVDYRTYALSDRRRNRARGLLAERSMIFRNQVYAGWMLSRDRLADGRPVR